MSSRIVSDAGGRKRCTSYSQPGSRPWASPYATPAAAPSPVVDQRSRGQPPPSVVGSHRRSIGAGIEDGDVIAGAQLGRGAASSDDVAALAVGGGGLVVSRRAALPARGFDPVKR